MADSFTPNYSFVIQQPGTNRSTWGGKLNSNWTDLDADLFAVSGVANSAQALATSAQALGVAALARAGGTMTGDLVLANVGPGSQYSAGFKGVPVVNFTGTRVLTLTDAGKMMRLTGTGSGFVQIPTVASVGLPVGTVIVARNSSTLGQLVIQSAPGGGVTIRKAGDATTGDQGVFPQGLVRIYHEATNVWVVEGNSIA